MIAPGALAGRLLSASLEGAVAIALVWLLCRVCSRLPPALRAALWWLACARLLVGLLGPGPLELPLLPARLAPAAAALPAGVPGAARSTLATPARARTAVAGATDPAVTAGSWRDRAVTIGICAWAGVALLLTLAALGRTMRLRALVARAVPAGAEMQQLAAEAARAAGLARPPVLLLGDEGDSPFVTGLLRPVLVLPAGLLRALARRELRLVLAHEVAHLARRDLWLGLLPAAARTLFFFHPLVRLAAREHGVSCEQACDAAALAAGRDEPHEYARILLTLGAARRPALAPLGALSSPSILRRRIEMLERTPHRNRPAILAWGLVLLAAVALVPFRLVAAAPDADAPPAPVRPAAPAVHWASAPVLAPAPVVVPASPAAVRPAAAPVPHPAHAPALAPAAAPPAPGVLAPPAIPAPPDMPFHAAMPGLPPLPALAPMALPPPGGPDAGPCIDLPGAADSAYLLFHGDSVSACGAEVNIRSAAGSRRKSDAAFWCRLGDHEYLITDRTTLDRLRSILGPPPRLDGEQERIGLEQAEAAVQQAHIGLEQAGLAREHAELAMQQARIAAGRSPGSRADDAGLERRMELLRTQMEELARRMAGLGREAETLGAHHADIGREHERLALAHWQHALEAPARLGRLIEEARAGGLAERLR